MPSSNYSAVAGSDHRDNHRVLKSLQAENTKLRERAVDIILEIEKIREAKYSPGPR
jgi:N-acetylmuramic acid 6-phosphate (MurNAc-6-P) etherase